MQFTTLYTLAVKGEFLTSLSGDVDEVYAKFMDILRPLCYLIKDVRMPEGMPFSAVKHVAHVYNHNNKIDAIKLTRAFYNLGLKDAKSLAEFCALVDYDTTTQEY